MPFHIKKNLLANDGLLVWFEGEPNDASLAFIKKNGIKKENNFFLIPSKVAFEFIKWANLNGGLFFQDKRLAADFFGKTFYNEEINSIYWGERELFLSDCELIGRGPPHFFIKGISLKQMPEDLSWEEILSALEPKSIPKAPEPLLVIQDHTPSFANLFIQYENIGCFEIDEVKALSQRNKKMEKEFEKDLEDCGYLKKTVGSSKYYCPQEKVFEAIELLFSLGWKIENTKKMTILPFSSSSKEINEEKEYLTIQGKVHFQEKELDLLSLKSFSPSTDLLPLDGKSIGLLPKGWKSLFGGWWEEAHVKDKKITLQKHHFGLFESVELQKNPSVLSELEIQGTLRPYQKEAVEWLSDLYQKGLHALLGDDMGLGKTIEVLAFLSRIKSDLPHLIVMPASLIFNWQHEINRFLSKKAYGHYGKDRKKDFSYLKGNDLVLTSYGTLKQDLEIFEKTSWHTLILDEAQYIKSLGSQTKQAVSKISAQFRISMTGTPLENHFSELYSQFHFLMPDLLGSQEDFENAIQEGRSEVIRKKIRPFFLRRKKEAVLKELPEKIEQTVWIEATPFQKELLSGLHQKNRSLLQGNWKKIEALEAILRLRQAAVHPELMGEKEASSAKLEALLIDLETIQEEGKKALIYSQFTSFLTLLERELKKRNLPYALLTGATKNREKEVDAFQNDPKIPFFLLSLKAGGVGLNLTKADVVCIFEPWWNLAAENQAIDRAYRMGRKDTVHVKRYLLKDSIEEKMEILKQRKKSVSDFFIEEEGTNFSKEDLLFLLEDYG